MTGELDKHAIDAFLRAQTVGHLACVRPGGQPYVVPITYAYDGTALVSYSADGVKLRALRRNPSACVAIDRIDDAANWVSVIANGTFAELEGVPAADALQLISEHLRIAAIADGTSHGSAFTYVQRLGASGVVFRIIVEDCSGRFSTTPG